MSYSVEQFRVALAGATRDKEERDKAIERAEKAEADRDASMALATDAVRGVDQQRARAEKAEAERDALRARLAACEEALGRAGREKDEALSLVDPIEQENRRLRDRLDTERVRNDHLVRTARDGAMDSLRAALTDPGGKEPCACCDGRGCLHCNPLGCCSACGATREHGHEYRCAGDASRKAGGR